MGKYVHRKFPMGWRWPLLGFMIFSFQLYSYFPVADTPVSTVSPDILGLGVLGMSIFHAAFTGLFVAVIGATIREYVWQQKKMPDGKSIEIWTDDLREPAEFRQHHSRSYIFLYLGLLLLTATGHLYWQYPKSYAFRISYHQLRLDYGTSEESRRYHFDRWTNESVARLSWLQKEVEGNIFYGEYYVAASKQYLDTMVKNLIKATPALGAIIKEMRDAGELDTDDGDISLEVIEKIMKRTQTLEKKKE